MKPLSIEGAWVMSPTIHGDDRGEFLEWYRGSEFRKTVGHHLTLAQANCSVSSVGVIRGIHFASVPPGQAKYVTCVSGVALDVVVDIRIGSSTFGQWDTVRLDEENRRSVYLSEGLGHAFIALSASTTIVYLVSEAYSPKREFGVHPLDKDLAIAWPTEDANGSSLNLQLAEKDQLAPSLEVARQEGLLPRLADCVEYRADLTQRL